MRTDTQKLALMVGLFVSGLAIFVAGFIIAMEVRSVVATPGEAPAVQLPNPGHGYDQIELPAGTWPGLDADRLDGMDAPEIGGISTCFYLDGQEGIGGDTLCGDLEAFCVAGATVPCTVPAAHQEVLLCDRPQEAFSCWRCCK